MPPLREKTTWLHGDLFRCLQPHTTGNRSWRLVLLGPPGVGKGTQAELLGHALGACPLSTGDLFRTADDYSLAPGSELAEAKVWVDLGLLVPDDLVLETIRHRRRCLRCQAGFLLDGFPRTIVQAAALDGMLAAERLTLDAAICYELPFSDLVMRMTGRRVCAHCHALYHVDRRRPRRDGVCDRCGGPLVRRTDDAPEPVAARLCAYVDATTEVAAFYRRRDLLITVDASGEPETILARTLGLLVARGFAVGASSPPTPLSFAATTKGD